MLSRVKNRSSVRKRAVEDSVIPIRPNRRTRVPSLRGARVGTLMAVDDGGAPLVAVAGRSTFTARTIVPLASKDVGQEVVILFASGERGGPIVMGVMNDGR